MKDQHIELEPATIPSIQSDLEVREFDGYQYGWGKDDIFLGHDIVRFADGVLIVRNDVVLDEAEGWLELQDFHNGALLCKGSSSNATYLFRRLATSCLESQPEVEAAAWQALQWHVNELRIHSQFAFDTLQRLLEGEVIQGIGPASVKTLYAVIYDVDTSELGFTAVE